MTARADVRRGLWIAVASFLLWGVMPLYWHALRAVPSLQIVMHRIVWGAVFVVGWLTGSAATGCAPRSRRRAWRGCSRSVVC